MEKVYEVVVSKTAKPAGNNQDWQRYDRERKEYRTLDEVKAFLRGEKDYGIDYRGHKRVKMYVDGQKGEAIHCGYIYSFNGYDWSRETGKKEHFTEQHWVSVNEIRKTPVIVKA